MPLDGENKKKYNCRDTQALFELIKNVVLTILNYQFFLFLFKYYAM